MSSLGIKMQIKRSEQNRYLPPLNDHFVHPPTRNRNGSLINWLIVMMIDRIVTQSHRPKIGVCRNRGCPSVPYSLSLSLTYAWTHPSLSHMECSKTSIEPSKQM